MKKFYKVCIFILALLLISPINFSSARYRFWTDKDVQIDTTPRVNSGVESREMTDMDQSSYLLSEKLDGILKLPQKQNYSTSLGYVLSLIKIAINWILWILSFVALVYMLYCWFLIFSSWSTDKNSQKGKKWISTAAIALAWIGLSWLIVSAMIWFITILSKAN